jgi:ribulose bisphosphate carboxylase small subunit
MAVTYNTPELISEITGIYRASWTSDQTSPTYRIYIDGVLQARQQDAFWEIRPNQILEVLDTDDAVPSPAFPAYLVLDWRVQDDADQYRIEQWDGEAWGAVATLAADHSRGAMAYYTSVLEDCTTHTWRVVPIDAAGNDGTAVQFVALLVRHPDVPSVSWAYNGSVTGTVTITAA